MSALALAWAFLRHRPIEALVTLCLAALAVGTMVVLLLLDAELKGRLTRDLKGIDLVVGAKGSPLQLILSAVFHLDVPTGNIDRAQAEAVANHRLVARAVPLALGDSLAGFRIVGTTADYVALQGGRLAAGRLWQDELQAVLGASVARRLGLGLGDRFVGSHGLGAGGGHGHDEHPFEVVGVLAATGGSLDRVILTAVESVWRVHERKPGPARTGIGGIQPAEARDELTALLVVYRSPMAAAVLPRWINSETSMQAASPATEAARLFALVGFALDAFRGFAYLLFTTSALGLFAALYGALRQRQYDLAIMRAVGASRWRLFGQLLLEGGLIGLAGAGLGLLVGHLAAWGLATWLAASQQVPLSGLGWQWQELLPAGGAMLLAVLAALPAAWRAYRLDVAAVLART
ncbi:MAG: ABC transporter permease [Alphaproteobacteria bacterium]|nr:ABC transporter permease [Alphaproteobacteria bacterium]